MKFLVVLAVAVACASADVSHLDAAAQVVRSDYEVSPEGNFHYVYETSNGINAQADGVVKGQGENAATEIKGQYSYTGNDGVPVSISYVADENGFQPQGSHLPVPPPIPELIQRSLEYIAAHPQAQDKYSANTANVASASASAKAYGK